jgi:hypothetical protein
VVAVLAAWAPTQQWWFIGGVWWLAMFPAGLAAHLEGLKRRQHERRTEIL